MRAFAFAALAIAVCTAGSPGVAQEKDALHPISEHIVERWLYIDVPLELYHDIKTPLVTEHGATMMVGVCTRMGELPVPSLAFGISGRVLAERAPLSITSHVRFVFDGKETVEYFLRPCSSVRAERRTESVQGNISLADFRAMASAQKVTGRLYGVITNGTTTRWEDVREFDLDAKALRSIVALDKRTRE